jgi:thermitase
MAHPLLSRIPRLLPLFCFILSQFSQARTAHQVPGEWIFVAEPGARLAWDRVKNDGFIYLRSFGPDGRFGLFHAEHPGKILLPRGVGSFQPNYRYRALDADPEDLKAWGLKNVGQTLPSGLVGLPGKDIAQEKAWTIHSGSRATVVAVLDSGIDLQHEDLKHNLWRNPGEIANNQIDDDKNGYIDDVYGWNFVDGSNQVQDDKDHGTMCAGIIGAESGNGKGMHGVNRDVQLMAVKILDASGGTTESVVSGLQYAVNNGAQILNASWEVSAFDQALYDTLSWADEKGVLVVAGAGNSAKNNDTDPNPSYPASFRLPNLISVAAYDARDSICDFSSYGSHTVDIGAPGKEIYSTKIGGYRYGDGTSFAAPFVSGTAALVKSYLPGLNNHDLRSRILETSEVIGYYEKEKTASAGRVNAFNALVGHRPQRPQIPTEWTRQGEDVGTSHPYPNNANLSYVFKKAGATHVRVHFINFKTSAYADHARIKDKQGRVVIQYSGNLGAFLSADVIGDTLEVQFVSDFIVNDYGFDIDFSESSYQTRWDPDEEENLRRDLDLFNRDLRREDLNLSLDLVIQRWFGLVTLN